MVEWLVKSIPLCPLVACLVTVIFGARVLREKSHLPVVIGCALACVCAITALVVAGMISQTGQTYLVYNWINVPSLGEMPELKIPITLRLDTLSAAMLSMVTFVATLVAVYASGYMHGDRSYWRFFACVALFVFSMLMLVLSGNFLQLFIFWEAVGLCSYMLIGFWYEKPAAAAAGKKAFLVNRIGDFGFAIGVFLLWTTFGSVEFDDILFNPVKLKTIAASNPGLMTTICLCLFTGAVGKSAQFPLHVWLPDAMEGPTPVSALIHAATMVTAGVYLVARCTPLFMLAPQAQLVVAIIGGLTALLAALIALTQTDLKRVLAYSTVSQLGYMFLGLGTGTFLGIGGAMFHLITHAFFKALLFLGAGSVMHSMGGVIDMRKFSGLKRIMPTTYLTFLIGSIALSGLFPFSGFWSKDTILAAVNLAANPGEHGAAHAVGGDGSAAHGDEHEKEDHGETGHETHAHGEEGTGTAALILPEASLLGISAPAWYRMLLWAGTFTAFLTAFYTFRAVFMTFHGEEKIPEEAGHHAHESPPSMCLPLSILSVGAALLGLVFGHVTGWFDTYLSRTIPELAEHHGMDWYVAGSSTVMAVGGIGLAWLFYGQPSTIPARIAGLMPPLTRLSENKFYLDEIYYFLLVLPLRAVAQLCRFLDWIAVDGLVGLVSRLPRDLGRWARPLQNGLVQFYALSMMLAMSMLMWALLWKAKG